MHRMLCPLRIISGNNKTKSKANSIGLKEGLQAFEKSSTE